VDDFGCEVSEDADSDGGGDAKAVGNLQNYLCSKFGSIPSAVGSYCEHNYYSYFSFLPFPCAAVALQEMMLYTADVMGEGVPTGYSSPTESLTGCMDDWDTTRTNYYDAFQAGSSYWKKSPRMMFGLFWVHSTYPNYPLCARYSTDAGGNIVLQGYGSQEDMNTVTPFDASECGGAMNGGQMFDSDGEAMSIEDCMAEIVIDNNDGYGDGSDGLGGFFSDVADAFGPSPSP